MDQMMINNVMVWERRLEIESQKPLQKDGFRFVIPTFRSMTKKLTWSFGWTSSQGPCESN